ncbi:MAG: alpha/beta fold hydrolase, partial [Oligoflexia bacterium]|nr:alpha/beta fold hydrolase [Oligoflexia bacterium]
MRPISKGNGRTPVTEKAVIFLHGFLGSKEDWDPFIKELAPLFPELRLLALDLPLEHDLAPKEWLAHICKEERIVASAFVGYSMGARLALYLADELAATRGLFLESLTLGEASEQSRRARREHDYHLLNKVLAREESFADFLERWYRQEVFSGISDHPDYQRLLRTRKPRLHNRNLSSAALPYLHEKLL